MSDYTVVVASFGRGTWAKMGDRAAETVEGAEVVRIHEYNASGNLASVRNMGLMRAQTPYVCWLDADDSLTPGYFDAMDKVQATIRQPSIPGWGCETVPLCFHHGEPHPGRRECLKYGNPLSAGAVIDTALAQRTLFDEKWVVLEDFAFWRKACSDPTVTIAPVPDAVYRTRTRSNGQHRNRSVPRDEWLAIAGQIEKEVPF